MIILRKGRGTKVLKKRLEEIYTVDTSNHGVRIKMTQVKVEDFNASMRGSLALGRPTHFAIRDKNHLMIYPRPDRDYRCHIVGTELVVL